MLELSHADLGRVAIEISPPERTHALRWTKILPMPQWSDTLPPMRETITKNFEVIGKRTKVALQLRSGMDIDLADPEKQVLSYGRKERLSARKTAICFLKSTARFVGSEIVDITEKC